MPPKPSNMQTATRPGWHGSVLLPQSRGVVVVLRRACRILPSSLAGLRKAFWDARHRPGNRRSGRSQLLSRSSRHGAPSLISLS
eukprot:scaffold149_cov315-Pinguiococcus_pyrenoidosus.AAC.52